MECLQMHKIRIRQICVAIHGVTRNFAKQGDHVSNHIHIQMVAIFGQKNVVDKYEGLQCHSPSPFSLNYFPNTFIHLIYFQSIVRKIRVHLSITFVFQRQKTYANVIETFLCFFCGFFPKILKVFFFAFFRFFQVYLPDDKQLIQKCMVFIIL